MSPNQAANFLNNLGLGDVMNLDVLPALAQAFNSSDGFDFSRIASFLRIAGIALIFLFLTFLIFALYKIIIFNRIFIREKVTPLKVPPLTARWEEIMRHAESLQEGQWKFSIIEADKLIDDVLKKLGYPGESVGDRLKFVRKENIPGLDELWHAHKLRNRLVHEPGYTLRREEMEEAIRSYEIALRDLGAL